MSELTLAEQRALSPEYVPRRQRAMIDLAVTKLGDVIADVLAVPTYQAAPTDSAAYPPAPVQHLINGPVGTGTSGVAYTVSGANAALWPLSVMCRLTTSATIADRTVALEYRDPGGARFLVAGTQAIVQASLTQSFCWHPQAGDVAWPIEDAAIAPLPQQHLFNGMMLALVVGNGQAGDVLDQVVISARYDPIAGE